MSDEPNLMKMTPREIVDALDKHIIGQEAAKRAAAIALRRRWLRGQLLSDDFREEVVPCNILMIGPTGVGKTEIARRLAKLSGAPFVKEEATKFTEVGYVGRDVNSIMRDLVDIAVKQERETAIKKVRRQAEDSAEGRILDALLPSNRVDVAPEEKETSTRQIFRKRLREGELDHEEIEIDVAVSSSVGVDIMGPPGMEEMTSQLQALFQQMGGGRTKTRKMTVGKAFPLLIEEEASKLINEEDIKTRAIENVEQNGIVFLDEIDKVAKRADHAGGDVSREGVQRDLLPLVEGCTVSTRYGPVKSDYVLFIASGAFHVSKPSDLIPEFQGRFPNHVELDALKAEEFVRILTEPYASLTEQYTALIAAEGVTLTFEDTGIKRIAEVAWKVNERTENIGARRLYTVMERLLENIFFAASERSGESVCVDAQYVDQHIGLLVEDEDLARYIL